MKIPTPDIQFIVTEDTLGEMSAGHYLARRSLEDVQATEGLYYGHQVMLQAAMDGANPTEGPLYKRCKSGNRELSIKQRYEVERTNQMCGRLETKLQQLVERNSNLLDRGQPDMVDLVEKEIDKFRELLDCAVSMRERPDIPHAAPAISKNPIPGRNE